MYLLNDVCAELNLSIDEARMCLMDVRQDWESCEQITQAEYELLKQSTQAALPDSITTTIQPVEGMPIEQQQQLIDNASQVLNFPLALSAVQEIKMVEALETAKNTVILGVVNQKRHELEETLAQLDSDRQQVFIQAITNIAELMPTVTNGTSARMQNSAKETNQQIDNLLKSLGK